MIQPWKENSEKSLKAQTYHGIHTTNECTLDYICRNSAIWKLGKITHRFCIICAISSYLIHISQIKIQINMW